VALNPDKSDAIVIVAAGGGLAYW